MNTNWQVFLANTSNMAINAEVTDYARSKSLQVALNKAGSFSCNLPIMSDTVTNTESNDNCIIVQKNGQIVWSGPITSREIAGDSSKINVTAIGWFDLLMDRYLDNTGSIPGPYSSANMGSMAFDLLGVANADKPTLITAGTNGCTSITNQTYEIWQSIGEEIEGLSNIETGFDFIVDPVTRQLNLTNWDDFTVNNNISFSFNCGPDNIAGQPNIQEDGSAMRNKVFGVGDTNVAVVSSSNLSSSPVQRTQIITSERDTLSILGTIANAELAVKENPPLIYNFDLKATSEDGNPYSIFEDFNIGDQIPLQMIIPSKMSDDDSYIEVNDNVRLFSATIDISDENIEMVRGIQTAYTG